MLRAIVFCVFLFVIGVLALINWPVFAALTPLSLGFTSVEAPLGLIMLGLVAFLCVLFTVWVVSLQASALFEARRQTRELAAQRELADTAEASRFTGLRADLMARLDRMQDESRTALEQSGNTLAAHLGALEDRLERAGVMPVEHHAEALRAPMR